MQFLSTNVSHCKRRRTRKQTNSVMADECLNRIEAMTLNGNFYAILGFHTRVSTVEQWALWTTFPYWNVLINPKHEGL